MALLDNTVHTDAMRWMYLTESEIRIQPDLYVVITILLREGVQCVVVFSI